MCATRSAFHEVTAVVLALALCYPALALPTSAAACGEDGPVILVEWEPDIVNGLPRWYAFHAVPTTEISLWTQSGNTKTERKSDIQGSTEIVNLEADFWSMILSTITVLSDRENEDGTRRIRFTRDVATGQELRYELTVWDSGLVTFADTSGRTIASFLLHPNPRSEARAAVTIIAIGIGAAMIYCMKHHLEVQRECFTDCSKRCGEAGVRRSKSSDICGLNAECECECNQ